MKEINYLEIIKSAFSMTWKNKTMWFFGFLVFMGSFSSALNNSETTADQKNQFFSTFQSVLQKYPLALVATAFIVILLLIALFLLKLTATTALIKISNNIAVYKQSKIKTIFSESKPFVWRLFIMDILILFSVFIIITILMMPIAYLFSLGSVVLASVFLTFGLIITVILLTLAYYLLRYGQIFLVLADMNLKASLESAYDLLEKNIKISLVFGLISIGLNIIFLVSLALAIIVIGFVFALIGFLLYQAFSNAGVIFAITIGAILLFMAIIFSFSWFNAFIQAAWVLFFQQISLEKKEDEKEKEPVMEADAIMPDPEAV